MIKKTKSSTQGRADNQLAAAVKDSAQQIWLAGLGAFAKAQEEGGKVFEALVREGKDIQGRTRSIAGSKLGEVTGRFGRVAGDVSRQATQSWDRLEQVFEERVARALNRLGVPTSADVEHLIARVDALNASVQALGGKPARASRAPAARKPAAESSRAAPAARAARTAPARKPAAAKPAARKPAARKSSAKAGK